jgi:CheY-like chemotaxis protein
MQGVPMEADKMVILVVEDEVLLRLQLVDPLEEAGFHVLTAVTGPEAIATLESEGGNIRALIADVNLGGGVTGWDVSQRAREPNPLLPIIYTTSFGPEDWAAHGVPNSVHIGKPFLPIQVVTALAQLLNTTTHTPSPSRL